MRSVFRTVVFVSALWVLAPVPVSAYLGRGAFWVPGLSGYPFLPYGGYQPRPIVRPGRNQACPPAEESQEQVERDDVDEQEFWYDGDYPRRHPTSRRKCPPPPPSNQNEEDEP